MAPPELCSAIFGGIRGGFFSYAIAKVVRDLRHDLLQSLVGQEIGFFDATKTGEITSRLTSDCQTMSDMVGININLFLRNTVMMIGSLVFMFKLSWQMTTITFVVLPLITIVSKVYGAYYERLNERVQTTLARANIVADEVGELISCFNLNSCRC